MNYQKSKEVNKSRFVQIIMQTGMMIVFLVCASIIGSLFRAIKLPEGNIVVVYILAVLLTARFSKGYGYGLVASIIATFAYNYFFTAPYFTFAVDDPSYIITIIIMTITAFITSALTSRVKENAYEAQQKEAETKALYDLTNRLTNIIELNEIVSTAVELISDVMECEAACIYVDDNDALNPFFVQQKEKQQIQIECNLLNIESVLNNLKTKSVHYIQGIEFQEWPIRGQHSILGLIRIPTTRANLMSVAQGNLLSSMIESIALAMDRYHVAKQRVLAQEEAAQERYRANLLRAISHDLRTPLTGIMGTSEMLMDMSQKTDPRYELVEGIHSDAIWLHSLVENILSLTRLQEGKLVIKKQQEAIEEIVGAAISKVSNRAKGQHFEVEVPEELLIVEIDGKLIEQLLINLLDNALKHTQKGDEIKVVVSKLGSMFSLTVYDEGVGISEMDLPNLFKMFYTSASYHVDAKKGIGIGLAICEAIVKAHGGSIQVKNRDDHKGAEFCVMLPIKGEIR